MNTRGLLIAAVALAVLAGAYFYSEKHPQVADAKPSADTSPKLVSFANAQIKRIDLKKRSGETLRLEQDSDGRWHMKEPSPGFAVDKDVADNIATAFTGLFWERLVEDKASDLGPYGLSSPSLEVNVATTNGKTQTLLLGDDTPTGGSAYAKLGGDPRVFIVPSSTKSNLDKSAADVRDKRMLIIDPNKLSRIEITLEGKNTFELGKNGQNEWQIVKPGPYRADGLQVEELIRKLRDAKIATDVPEAEEKKYAAAFGKSPPVLLAKFTDNSGTQQIFVRKYPMDQIDYAQSSAVPGIYKLAPEVSTGLEKTLDDYRNHKLFDFGFNELTAFTMRDGAKTVQLQKFGNDWRSNAQVMDSVGVQNLTDKLRDLAALNFTDQGQGSAPTLLDIKVVWGDSKRTEHVKIWQEGTGFRGVREGESTVYQIAPTFIKDLRQAAADLKTAQAANQTQKK